MLPPFGVVAEFLKNRDDIITSTAASIMELGSISASFCERGRLQLFTPIRDGGFGLRHYEELSYAAHWASWVDSATVFYKVRQTLPLYDKFIESVQLAQHGLSIRRLQDCCWYLEQRGYQQYSWQDMCSGANRPLPDEDDSLDVTDAGFWTTGWQNQASKALISYDRSRLMQLSNPEESAVIESSCGPMSRWLIAVPKSEDLCLDNASFLTGLRRRFSKSVPTCPGPCAANCTVIPDARGHHRATCNKTGFFVRRHYTMANVWERVFILAGGRVQTEVMLSDTCIARHVPSDDARRMDLVVHGIPTLFAGRPLFCDVTVLSPVSGTGEPRFNSDTDQGAVLLRETERKTTHYAEVANSEDVRWMVLGHEVYGFSTKEVKVLVRKLAEHKSKGTNLLARRAAQILWSIRFWDMLACTLIRSMAQHYVPGDSSGRRSSYVHQAAPYLEDLM